MKLPSLLISAFLLIIFLTFSCEKRMNNPEEIALPFKQVVTNSGDTLSGPIIPIKKNDIIIVEENIPIPCDPPCMKAEIIIIDRTFHDLSALINAKAIAFKSGDKLQVFEFDNLRISDGKLLKE